MATIGIDLGTTNSLAAYWSEDGPVLIPNALGEHLTPSVVSVDESGTVLVGQIAKERLITHPDSTAAVFKRFMGTEKTFQLGKHRFTPEALSAFVIQSLKADAEALLGEEVTEAVISVPAYFNDTQRTATKRAAELAGLKVERLINEPTAAAISYGLHEQQEETKIVVFDLGGGTFDVSVLEFFEGVMEVNSIAGDNFLGGEDFTRLLFEHGLAQSGIDERTLDAKMRSAVWKQAEQCKQAVSERLEGRMSFTREGSLIEVRVNREAFERLAGELVLRLRHPIERAMRDAEQRPADIDAVILIGGATRMPMIKSIVGKLFGKLPYTQINPDEAVALGAAVQVALKERHASLREVVLTDVCPYTLGVEVAKQLGDGKYEQGYFSPIIERNTPIPVSRMDLYRTVQDKQRMLRLNVYQGESRRVENNLLLGALEVDVPADGAGRQTVNVRFTYDINGILEVEATAIGTGKMKRAILMNRANAMSEREIAERFRQLKDIKVHPRDQAENRLLLARGERLYEEALGSEREEIGALIDQFEQVLASQDLRETRKAADRLKAQLDHLERRND